MRDDIIDRLLKQVADINKQLKALQRLDVSPPPASLVTYSGTPSTGQLAQWSGAGTLTQSGYAGSAVARYSGAPVAGRYPVWTAAGTIADSGFGTADLPRYTGTPTAGQVAVWSGAGTIVGTANVPRYTGTPTAGAITYWAGMGTVAHAGYGTADVFLLSGDQTAAGDKTFSGDVNFTGALTVDDEDVMVANGDYGDSVARVETYIADIGDIGSTQALTIDITVASGGGNKRAFVTDIWFVGHSAASSNIWAYVKGWVAWRYNGSGSATIIDDRVSHDSSGTNSSAVSAITNGIRIVIDSSAFGGTLDRNTLRIETTRNAIATTVSTSIT